MCVHIHSCQTLLYGSNAVTESNRPSVNIYLGYKYNQIYYYELVDGRQCRNILIT